MSIGQSAVDAPIGLTYLVFDASGSTRRGGWIDACNRAMPHLIQALEQSSSDGTPQSLCVISYNDTSRVTLPLSDVRLIAQLPSLIASGFSSLASAMELLSEVLSVDMTQLEADGVAFCPPTVIVVADGLPTDEPSALLGSREMLAGIEPHPPCLHIVHPTNADLLFHKGMGFNRIIHAPYRDAPDQLARCVLEAIHCQNPCPGPI